MMEFTFDGIVRQGFGFYNPNHAAALICAIFPFLWGWKKYAWIGWMLTFLLTVPLVMTYSRTGVLVLAFELAAYFIISKTKNWKLIAAIAGGILLILLIGGIFGRFTLDKAVANRPEIWLAGLKLYAANPPGVGLSNSGMIVSNFMLENIIAYEHDLFTLQADTELEATAHTVLQYYPDNFQNLNMLGVLYILRNDLSTGEIYLKKAQALAPDDQRIKNNLQELEARKKALSAANT